ncbi:MAG: molybdate ABC transporter substrate-binding protein [Chloroflexi bacterium]|nr:molybdate ABC transporter substrate-binding protein [Chloroflexota bacterium]
MATAVLADCGLAATTPAPTLLVFAAASLRDAIDAEADAYQRATGVPVIFSTDSSAALRAQIEQGAEVDVFLSADTRNPEALAAAGLIDGEVVAFAGNRLAIVVPGGNPAGIASPFDLGRPGVRVIAAGDSVPISGYAATLLDALAGLPGAPAGLADGYAANVVSHEDSVSAVLSKIELGEGDAAIVYATDAAASARVIALEIPAEADVVATYAGVVPDTAGWPEGGHAFLDWMVAPDGQAILARFGFLAPP